MKRLSIVAALLLLVLPAKGQIAISALTELAVQCADNDWIVIVDVSDLSQSASGSTRKIQCSRLRVDTETELEAQLTDVSDIFTNNDGALNDDDVTLSDVQTATTSDFHNIGGVDDDIPESGDFGNATDLETTGAISIDAVGTAKLDDDANTPLAGDFVIIEVGALSFDYLTPNVGTDIAADLEEEGVTCTDCIDLAKLDDDAGTPLAGDLLTVRTGATDIAYTTPNAGTDITADLEEETHATEHQDGGADEVATATPGANAIPKAEADGDISVGWIPLDAAYAWTGAHDYAGGTLEIPQSATPTCTAVGQLFMDTDATTGQRLYACEAASGSPTLQGDGGGGGGDNISVNAVALVDANFTDSTTIGFVINRTASPDEISPYVLDNSITSTHIDETDTYTWSGANLLTGVHEVADDVDFNFGTDADWSVRYEETTRNNLLFETTATGALAATDPMFHILVGTTPTADQDVFEVGKGTPAANTTLFNIDEDGDGVFTGTLTVGDLLDVGSGSVTVIDGVGGDLLVKGDIEMDGPLFRIDGNNPVLEWSSGNFSFKNAGNVESSILVYSNQVNIKNASSATGSWFRVGDATGGHDYLAMNGTTTYVSVGHNLTPARRLHVEEEEAATTTVSQALRLGHITTSAPAAGIGTGMEFSTETTASNNEIGATIEAVTTDVTALSEDFDLVFKTMAGGAAAAERFRISSSALTTPFDIAIDNGSDLVLYEGDAGGSNFISQRAAPAITTDVTLEWSDDFKDCIAGEAIEVVSNTAGVVVLECDTDDGAGGGETNTISSQGGGLAFTAATPKVGVDLRVISGNAADFDLAADVLSIDDTKWAQDSELPVGANPTASVGLSAVNGAAATFMRSDAAPALDVSIAPTWTAQHIFSLEDAGTTTVLYPVRTRRTSSAAPAAGIGVGTEFEVETADGNNEVGALIEAVTTDVTATSEDFDLVFKTMAAGATATERLRLSSINDLTLTGATAARFLLDNTSASEWIINSAALGELRILTAGQIEFQIEETTGNIDALGTITNGSGNVTITNAAGNLLMTAIASSTSADLRGVLSDESGTGAAIFAGGDVGAATATTPAADDNDTSVATTAYVQTELTALASDTQTLTNKTLDYAAAGNVITFPVSICAAISDETTALETGTAKVTMRAPFAFTVNAGGAGVRASLTAASSSGIPTFDINESGVTILSTKVTIDASELTSTTAVTPVVVSDTAIADDAQLTFDIDVAGTGATGAKICILGTRAL